MAEYIARKALDDALTAAAANDKDKNRRTWAKAICVLHDIPAADVVPVVHGRWVPVDEVPPCGEWRCAACGDTRTFVWDMSTDDMRGCYAYCPNCGARMDGDSDGQTD